MGSMDDKMTAASAPAERGRVGGTPTTPAHRQPMAVDRHDSTRIAMRKSLASGLAGGASMVAQVVLLLPLDTTITYQYRFGVCTRLCVGWAGRWWAMCVGGGGVGG